MGEVQRRINSIDSLIIINIYYYNNIYFLNQIKSLITNNYSILI